MRKFAFLMIVVMLASVALGQAGKTAKPAASNDAAQLTDIENKWNSGLLKPDTDYIDSITAPGYVSTETDGRLLTKSQMLDDLKSGKVKVEAFDATDIKTHLYGDAAVVTAAFTEKGVQDGKPFAHSGRYTDFFVKKNGQWLAVATHSSAKPAAKAAAKPAAKAEKK